MELEAPEGTYQPHAPLLLLAEEAERRLPLMGDLLDLGCGVGTIALRVAQRNPLCKVTGVDINETAILAAKGNAYRNGVQNASFIQSDVYDGLGGQTFDVIACSIPWEGETNYPDGTDGPREAFIDEGYAHARALGYAKDHLRPGGWFVMWGPAAIGKRVFEMVGLTAERYVYDNDDNCVVLGHV